MADLEQTYKDLEKNLLINSVFYIYKSFIVDNNFHTDPAFTFASKIILMSDDFGEISIDNLDVNKCAISILKKATFLQSNTFKLLKLKTELDNAIFNCIAEKYIKVLSEYTSISLNLLNNFDVEAPNNCSELKMYFIIQNKFFQDHLAEVEKITGIISKNSIDAKSFPSIKSFRSFPLGKSGQEKIDSLLNIKETKEKKAIIVRQFREFIKHDKNVEIERIVKLHLSDLKGKPLRYLIEYFIDKNVLLLQNGIKSELRRSFSQLFDGKDVGVDNSIFPLKIFNPKDQEYLATTKIFDSLFIDIFTSQD